MGIGDRLRTKRLEIGLTQEGLAEAAQAAGPGWGPGWRVRQGDISRWESGETPGADRLPCLANALGVSLQWLITGIHAPSSPGSTEAA